MKHVVLGLGLAACASTPTVVHAPGATIAVTSAGSREGARVVRFRPALHAPARVEIEIKVSGSQTSDTLGTQTLETPTLKVLATREAIERRAHGEVAVAETVDDATMMDDVADATARARADRALAELAGWHATSRMAANGAFGELLETPAGARAPSIVFPDTAIGTGATWFVTDHARDAGVTWDVTTSYRLTALGGDRATVAFEQRATAAPQPLAASPQVTRRLVGGSSTTTGEGVVALDGLAVEGKTMAQTQTRVLVSSNGKTIAWDSAKDTRVTASPPGAHTAGSDSTNSAPPPSSPPPPPDDGAR